MAPNCQPNCRDHGLFSGDFEPPSLRHSAVTHSGRCTEVEPEPVLVNRASTAILDRLLHHCEVISINGPSYRLKRRLKAIERENDVA
nr:ATP-binding protein [Streptomyces sp. L2]